MKEFVEYVLKALVERPEAVRTAEIQGHHNIVMEVRCHPEDMGRVIGKNGKTIGAVRALLNGIAARKGLKIMLEVVE
jgi:uncharacterized protein